MVVVVFTKAIEDGGCARGSGRNRRRESGGGRVGERTGRASTYPPITRSVINAPRYTFNLNSTECRRSLTCARFILGPSPVAGVNLAQNYGDGPGRPC